MSNKFSPKCLVACNIYVSAGGGGHAKLLLNLLEEAQKLCWSTASASSPCCASWPSTTTNSSSKTATTSAWEEPDAIGGNGNATTRVLPRVAVVHAFADRVYNRSSFHLAGHVRDVARVASSLTVSATQGLLQLQQQEQLLLLLDDSYRDNENNDNNRLHPHPTVGLVDHIAVMPLTGMDRDDDSAASSILLSSSNNFEPSTAIGWAARQIGQALMHWHQQQQQQQQQILQQQQKLPPLVLHYYGSAHPEGTPLATVRREQTNFFKSNLQQQQQQQELESAQPPPPPPQQLVTVLGAPNRFVENFNIRLSALPSSPNDPSSRSTAQSLTRYVRERDGGLTGVEALTLPYSQGRWEVACNLLCPDFTSAKNILARVLEWEEKEQTTRRRRQQQQQSLTSNNNPAAINSDKLVEKCYRVGTTAGQCLQVLSLQTTEERQAHDRLVMERLKGFLLL